MYMRTLTCAGYCLSVRPWGFSIDLQSPAELASIRHYSNWEF